MLRQQPEQDAGVRFINEYEKVHGKNPANQFAAHAFDAHIVLAEKASRWRSRRAPGTKFAEFRAGLKGAGDDGPHAGVAGVLNHTPDDHFGFTNETGVLLTIVNGDWKVVQLILADRAVQASAMDASIAGILTLDGATNGAVYALMALATGARLRRHAGDLHPAGRVRRLMAR